MPATNYRWNTFGASEVEHVFGVFGQNSKRKVDEPHSDNQEQHDDQIARKRICNWTQHPMMMSDQHIQQQQPPTELNNLVVQQQQQQMQNGFTNQPMVQQTQAVGIEQFVSLEQQMPKEREMLMNINEDDGGIDDYQSAYETMDSEGAPDPSQYGTSNIHDTSCLGPEQSPNSGKIRCYCRPSWESSNAFYSDIY